MSKEELEKKYSSMSKDELLKILRKKGKEVDRLKEIYDKVKDADDPNNYYELENARREFKKAYDELKFIGSLCGHDL